MVELVCLLFMANRDYNGPALVRGQVSSWLNCAESGRGGGIVATPVWLPQCDDVLKFVKKLIVKSHTH
jgi:hypothetical protein